MCVRDSVAKSKNVGQYCLNQTTKYWRFEYSYMQFVFIIFFSWLYVIYFREQFIIIITVRWHSKNRQINANIKANSFPFLFASKTIPFPLFVSNSKISTNLLSSLFYLTTILMQFIKAYSDALLSVQWLNQFAQFFYVLRKKNK